MSEESKPTPVPKKVSSPDAQEHLEPVETETTNKSKQGMDEMLKLYLASNPSYRVDKKINELEIRFGTAKPVSRIDYDNVVKQLYAAGFTPETEDGYTFLRIYHQYLDARMGTYKTSNIRAEIVGMDMVQEYCKTNSIQKLIDMPSYLTVNYEKIKFTQKTPARQEDGRGGNVLKPVDMRDFNFRMSYQLETEYSVRSNRVKSIIEEWHNSKKTFRYMNRVRFSHPDYPVFVDISIVKSSKKTGNIQIPQYTIQDANVFNNPETYEIELEVNNAAVGMATSYSSAGELLRSLRKVIRIVLSGLQGTYYPIAYSERSEVLQDYMRLVHGDTYEPRWVKLADFIGPSSYTLQTKNVGPLDQDSSVPNIRSGYTVTDKADGERKLLYVGQKGHIYMIDTNMNVIYTGMLTKEKTVFNTIIDGEHIKYDKRGEYINLYAAFDIYYVNKVNVREWAFIETADDLKKAERQLEKGESAYDPLRFRLRMLNKVVTLLKPVFESSEQKGMGCKFDVRCKDFYAEGEGISIFRGCAEILSKVEDGAFVYNTDGLIFTPASMGVGGSASKPVGPLKKITWEYSFKWKPPKYNTIDFLVTVKKDKSGRDEVYHVFEDGINLQKAVKQISQYKILELYVGFDSSQHGHLNAMEDVIHGRLPSPDDIDNTDQYQPALFQPTSPYDPKACYCNRMVSDKGVMLTEEGEILEGDTIVEFSYDDSKSGAWKWVPLRVRYDKTSELRNGLKNYGNAYHVANNNWHSIHHPVTEKMISTGEGIEVSVDEDVYYNRGNSDSHTVALRDFHNRFVKNRLITGVANRGDTLIDYAVGKAGDLSKWVSSHLSFVFGIDISRDNLENYLDGACARYLKDRRKYGDNMPYALFAQGNSALNIREEGEAMMGNKDKQIAAAVFGNGPKDRSLLGEGVYQQWGKGKEGFTISSCQFAIHYFFENRVTFHNFMRNVAECTRLGGYFIGTCYDGKTVFNRLQTVAKEKSIRIDRNGTKIYELTKMYSHSGFPADDTSLGYSINVYQETINKTAMEYLVNFDFLKTMMENYGFTLISKAEAKSMGLPSGSGLFSELFTEMQQQLRSNPEKASEYRHAPRLSEEEKSISFMNRYFVFRKKYSVDAKKKFRLFVNQRQEDQEDTAEKVKAAPRKYKATKLKVAKFKIENYAPIHSGEVEPEVSP